MSNSTFEQIDDWLNTRNISRQSLRPNSAFPLSFAEVGHYLYEKYPQEHTLQQLLAQFAQQFIAEQITHFPENIFWDYAHFFAYMFEDSLQAAHPTEHLQQYRQKNMLLLARFGLHSPIRFRYMHDFLYGFDWARWVKKAPNERAHIHPFSHTFLDYLLQRGKELEELIRNNDAKYHPLSDERYRNPFFFSRNPHEEAHLLRSLAADGLIPVPGWQPTCTVCWDLPFARLRQERAEQLGIAQK